VTGNDARIARGISAVHLHPDYHSSGLDFKTAAVDIIADILHAVFSADRLGSDHPEDLLDRAYRCYLGDLEDDE
jgi:hypothetical protein